MLMVGLTGGIGAGKSVVARRLAQLGAVVIDSDQLARAAVAPGTEGLAEVVAAFGREVLTPTGELDRSAMAHLVFADPDRRERLERIVHPRVRAGVAARVAAAPPDAVVVNDVPLLVEAGLAGSYDLVMVVLASPSTRVARLVGDRGMSQMQAQARIAAQATDEQRTAVADIVLVNDGTVEQLHRAVDAAWRDVVLPRLGPSSAHRDTAHPR